MNSFLRCVAAVLALCAAAPALAQGAEEKDNIAGPYVPTPWVIVDEMLKLAGIRGEDVVYDLGSGDGRLVITAAKRFGARGVGVELQTELVELARIGAKHEGVADRVKFVQGDLFETDIKDASVVMLYLLPRFVTRLVPRLRAELRPGTRIVSHDYPLAPWPPDRELSMDVAEKEMISGTSWTRLYYYVVPARVQGVWELTLPRALADAPLVVQITQEPHATGGLIHHGNAELFLRDLTVRGEGVRFGLLYRSRLIAFEGTVNGKTMTGEARAGSVREPWTARYLGPLQR
ncbi:MAG: methyltransferase domain-containing protein [Betaproteobacteria bacterium]|nr:MAG: methyltransferase domain-containing protein [Betaproteobacteria bacterium]TMH74180.1 MAG: methyltransferase domain-containing protein [Betaproteobacteria bacterium]